MKKVSEYVTENFKASGVFKKYKIDFCCNGGITLEEACKKKSVNYEDVISDLENLNKADSNDIISYLDAKSLVRLIIDKHHNYLREALPIIEQFAKKVSLVHGVREPNLVSLFETFMETKKNIENHLLEEEEGLFNKITNNNSYDNSELESVLENLETEHVALGQSLEKMRKLANDYKIPMDACNTYRVLFRYLEDMESDIHMHIHLENNILHNKLKNELVNSL